MFLSTFFPDFTTVEFPFTWKKKTSIQKLVLKRISNMATNKKNNFPYPWTYIYNYPVADCSLHSMVHQVNPGVWQKSAHISFKKKSCRFMAWPLKRTNLPIHHCSVHQRIVSHPWRQWKNCWDLPVVAALDIMGSWTSWHQTSNQCIYPPVI